MTITGDHTATTTENGADEPLTALWAEITGKCQLSCTHCYAGSGPDGTHGTMTVEDWERVLGEAASLGTRLVCFIGGEPVLHAGLPRLVRAVLSLGMQAEIFSNLVYVSPVLWDLFSLPGVSLATSWYTDDRAEHAAITGRDTWRQTLGNIKEAVRREIPLRVGLIDGILPDQHAAEGEELLQALGVTGIGTDRLREFGRGTLPDPSQACGHCGHGRAAVLPNGATVPCPMTRWMVAGNVRETGLGEIMTSVTSLAATLPVRDKTPLSCNPNCVPDSYCNPLCTPGACKPRI